MAHEINTTAEGSEQFVFSRSEGPAWHNLGTEIPEGAGIKKILRLANLDFEVEKHPLRIRNPHRGKDITKEGVFNTIGNFGDDERESLYLGTVGNYYHPIQNETLLETALDIVKIADSEERAASISAAGMLSDGRIFFTIQLPSKVLDPNGINDEIQWYLAVVTAHDGSTSSEFMQSLIRTVCSNTITAASHAARAKIKFRHTKGSASRITVNELRDTFAIAMTAGEKFEAEMTALMRAEGGGWKGVTTLADKLWLPAGVKKVTDLTPRAEAARDKRMDILQTLWNADTNTVAGEGWYRVMNTLTEYTEHGRKRQVGRTREDDFVNGEVDRMAGVVADAVFKAAKVNRDKILVGA